MPQRKPREYFELSQDDRIMIKKVEILTSAVEKVYPSSKMLIWRSFLQGIFVAVGLTIGMFIIFGILIFVFAQLKFFQPVGNFLKNSTVEKVLPLDK